MLKKLPVTPNPQATLIDIFPYRWVSCGLEFHITIFTLRLVSFFQGTVLPSFCAIAHTTPFYLVLSSILLHWFATNCFSMAHVSRYDYCQFVASHSKSALHYLLFDSWIAPFADFSFTVRTILSRVSRWRWRDTAGRSFSWVSCALFLFLQLPCSQRQMPGQHPLTFCSSCVSRTCLWTHSLCPPH